MIKKVRSRKGSKYILYSKDGKKKLGEFDTFDDAKKREHQINFFKYNKTDKK